MSKRWNVYCTAGTGQVGVSEYGDDGKAMHPWDSDRAKDQVICYLTQDGEPGGNAKTRARARLIAAAPELYARLTDLNEAVEAYLALAAPSVDAMNDLTTELRSARGALALAKAEGK